VFINCHTAFSFKYGTLTVQKLFDEARRCGVHKLALTEINNVASYIEMLRLCKENAPHDGDRTIYGKPAHSLNIAVGVEFRKGNELLYIVLAKNNLGFEKLNRVLSYHNAENKPFPPNAPELEETFVVYPFGRKEKRPPQACPSSFHAMALQVRHPPPGNLRQQIRFQRSPAPARNR
jgi:DNA polymerase-3 subunit alpha